MNVSPTFVPASRISPLRPLKLGHPLLRGLRGWWYPVSTLTGGVRQLDLSPYNAHGDFANGLTHDKWERSHQLKMPVIDFGGPTNRWWVQTPIDMTSGFTDFTWAAWAYFNDNTERNHVMWAGDVAGNGGGGEHEIHISHGNMWDNGNSTVAFYVRGSSDSNDIRITISDTDLGGAGSLVNWHFLIGSVAGLDGGTMSARYHAYQPATRTQAFRTATGTGADPSQYNTNLRFGAPGADTSRNLNGRMTAPMVWDRALSGLEMRQVYEQTIRGYPDLLNRRDTLIPLTSAGPGDDHTLSPANLTTSPTLSEPTFSQVHVVTANDLASSPILEAAGLTQDHQLAPAELASAPTLEAAAITQVHDLTPATLSTSPALAAAALTQVHELTPADLASSPSLSEGGLTLSGDDHQLAPDALAVATTLAEGGIVQDHQITPAALLLSPAIAAASITQNHIITPSALTSSPALSQSGLNLALVLGPNDLTSAPALEATGLVETHLLGPDDLALALTLKAAGLIQVHVFSPDDLALSPFLSAASLGDRRVAQISAGGSLAVGTAAGGSIITVTPNS